MGRGGMPAAADRPAGRSAAAGIGGRGRGGRRARDLTAAGVRTAGPGGARAEASPQTSFPSAPAAVGTVMIDGLPWTDCSVASEDLPASSWAFARSPGPRRRACERLACFRDTACSCFCTGCGPVLRLPGKPCPSPTSRAEPAARRSCSRSSPRSELRHLLAGCYSRPPAPVICGPSRRNRFTSIAIPCLTRSGCRAWRAVRSWIVTPRRSRTSSVSLEHQTRRTL